MQGNPNPANIQIRRNSAEGGHSDITETNGGQAWFYPIWWRSGNAGIGMSSFDLYAEKSRLAVKDKQGRESKWEAFVGLHINRNNTLNDDKSEWAIYFRYNKERWGAALYATKWYLLANTEMNHNDWGCRMDEFLDVSLSMVGLEKTYGARREFQRVLDVAASQYRKIRLQDRERNPIKEAIQKQLQDKLAATDGYIDHERRYDRLTGKEVQPHMERLDGSHASSIRVGVGYDRKDGAEPLPVRRHPRA